MVSRKNWSQETCLSDRKILIRMGYRRHKLCLRWQDSICADMIPNHISFFILEHIKFTNEKEEK